MVLRICTIPRMVVMLALTAAAVRPVAAQTGACCQTGGCSDTTEAGCTNGTFLGGGTDCTGVDCSGVLGACCSGTACFPNRSPSSCGGVFSGYGTSCAFGSSCSESIGACCAGEPSDCFPIPVDEGTCAGILGEYAGDGTTCDMLPDPCGPQPARGACCFPDVCVDGVTADGCAGATGNFMGDDSTCAGVVCGACGDNVVQPGLGEACDGTDDSACTCSSCYPPGHAEECTCAPDPVCGNNIVEECEVCDGTDDAACPGGCDVDCTCLPQPLTVSWFTMDGGGGTSTGGTFTVRSTIGQHDAGEPLAGGTYAISGGFWPPLAAGNPADPPLSAPAPHDRRKNRYVSFVPNNTADVAFRIQKTTGTTGGGWIGTPDANGIAKVVGTAVTRVWTEPTVHIGDCEIIPLSSYDIDATADGGTTFSAPLTVSTIAQPTPKFWGDTVGGFVAGAWEAPNGVVNANDFVAALQGFQVLPSAPHVSVTDVQSGSASDPCLNRITNFADVFLLIKAFQGEPYPFTTNPGACPSCP